MIKILPHERIDVLSRYKKILEETDPIQFTGRVERIVGLTIESIGPVVKYGDLCRIKITDGEYLHAEVVGFNKNRIILMPIGEMQGVVPGAQVFAAGSSLMVPVGEGLLGRVISGIGVPLDGLGPLDASGTYPLDGKRVNPMERVSVETPLSVGVRAVVRGWEYFQVRE
jgi:flagellum-specific ATP synthase